MIVINDVNINYMCEYTLNSSCSPAQHVESRRNIGGGRRI